MKKVEFSLREALDMIGDIGWRHVESVYGSDTEILLHRGRNYGRGDDPVLYRSLGELQRIQMASRRLCRFNEFALCALENRVNYVAGEEGFGCDPQPAIPHNSESVDCAARVKDFVEMFNEANDIAELQQESLTRLDEDGECFIRLFYRDDGTTDLRFVETEHVISPIGDTSDPNLSYGIETAPGDIVTPLRYFVIEDPSNGSTPVPVSENEIVHIKLNVKTNYKRGVPTFVPVGPNLLRCEELLASMAHLAKTRAKIALIRKMTGVSSQTASGMIEKLTAIKRTDAIGQEDNVERLKYGSILTAGGNQEYQFPEYQFGALDFVEVLQAELRAIASRFCMPEWMFTALADAKYNNAFVVEAPAQRMFSKLQKKLHRRWITGRVRHRRSVYWRAIAHAVKCGLLPRATFQLVTLAAVGPTLINRDKKEEAEVNDFMLSRGMKTAGMIQREQGIDPDETQQSRVADLKEGRALIPLDTFREIRSLLAEARTGTISPDEAHTACGVLLGVPKQVVAEVFPVRAVSNPNPVTVAVA